MNALMEFVRHGIVGELRLGMQRHEVEMRLGKPKTWLGRPPCFGPAVQTPDEAEAWLYYGGAGIKFDDQGVVVQVSVLPEHIKKDTEPFLHWPIDPGIRMCDWRALLVENQIDFDEGEDNKPGGYYILAERRCTASGIPYEGGKLVPELKRRVSFIGTVSSEDYLPPFVLRYWRHGSAQGDHI